MSACRTEMKKMYALLQECNKWKGYLNLILKIYLLLSTHYFRFNIYQKIDLV